MGAKHISLPHSLGVFLLIWNFVVDILETELTQKSWLCTSGLE